MLRLRALRSSGDLEEYWTFHERMERMRNHEAQYANGELPRLTQPDGTSRRTARTPSLRVVK